MVLDAVGNPQTILLLGGTSEIGLAICERYLRDAPARIILAALPVLALQLLFTPGLGILLGTVNVFFRDVGQMTGVVLQFWFWLTPIVYTVGTLPEAVQNALSYNPMLPIIASYQGIFLQHQAPDWASLISTSVLTLGLLLVGFVFFMRRVGEMVDEL